jgi:hypothetical protein
MNPLCTLKDRISNVFVSFLQIGDSKVERVFCPRTGELVDATIESFIYQVKTSSVFWYS